MTTVCIDLDGTLTDPQVGITRCIQHALEQLGRDAPEPQDLTWCIGPPLQESFQKLLGNAEDANRALSFYRERFTKIGLYENELYDGIPSALTEMVSAGDQLFVATRKPTIFAERIIQHFGLAQYFETVFGSELDGTRADKTELLAWIIEQRALRPSDTSMIGDRRHDIIGARNNSLRSIGVLYGYGSREELTEAGADTLCAQPTELAALIARMR